MRKEILGPVDELALGESLKNQSFTTEDLHDIEETQRLLQHLVEPFKLRIHSMIPSYGPTDIIDSYFHTLFP